MASIAHFILSSEGSASLRNTFQPGKGALLDLHYKRKDVEPLHEFLVIKATVFVDELTTLSPTLPVPRYS